MFLDRVKDLLAYETFNLVAQKRARGETVHSLAIGEPSFDTPAEIVRVAHQAMKRGETHYGPSYGTDEVRSAVAEKVRKRNRIKADIENTIFVTTKFAVYASLCSVARAGYEALVPDPGYYYSEPVILSGGRPVPYRLSKDFDLDLAEVRRKLTPRTRAIVINTPSNPCGKVLKKDLLQDLLALCQERSIRIISDESYADLVYEGRHVSVGSLESSPQTVMTLFSLSKSFAMTGWRAGYMTASVPLIKLVNRLMENTMTCFPQFIETASAYALRNCHDRTLEFRAELKRRRALIEKLMDDIPQLTYQKAEGAFYSFPKYRGKTPSRKLTKALIERYDVALLPGSIFGSQGEGHLRLSFAAAPETITSAMEGLSAYLRENR